MYTNSVDPIICNSVLIKDIEGHILGTHLKFPRSTAANTIIKKKILFKGGQADPTEMQFFSASTQFHFW